MAHYQPIYCVHDKNSANGEANRIATQLLHASAGIIPRPGGVFDPVDPLCSLLGAPDQLEILARNPHGGKSNACFSNPVATLHQLRSELAAYQRRQRTAPPGSTLPKIKFNVHPACLAHRQFAKQLVEALDKHHFDARNFDMELTEQPELQLLALRGLQRIHDAGIPIWLDDVGSVSQPAHKLGRELRQILDLVAGIKLDGDYAAHPQAVRLALPVLKHLNIPALVVERIETRSHASQIISILKELKVEIPVYIQGWVLGRARPWDSRWATQ